MARALLLPWLVVALCACDGMVASSGGDASTRDARVAEPADGGRDGDGGSTDEDAGLAADDAGPWDDAGADPDAGLVADAGTDAGSGIDAGTDGGSDGGTDGGPPEDFFSSDREVARAIGWHGSPRGFWEYLPPSASSGPSPLLVALHGVGENGDGSLAQLPRLLRNGPTRFIHEDAWPADRPFIVLSPQNASGCPSASGVAAFIEWAVGEYDVDPDRIYLTGLSCGAIGIANYLRTHAPTTTVAAVVAISGDWRAAWSSQMCALGRVAVWAIHGEADTNPGTLPAFTETPITSLLACPQPPRRDVVLTMLPGVGHTDRAWDDTYSGANGLDIYTWMLDHPRAP